MLDEVPDILARIVAAKRLDLEARAGMRAGWEKRAGELRATHRDFRGALVRRTPAVIAEIKKASPSKGLLAGDFQPARTASLYEAGGAAALSVLTDEKFFQGRMEDLVAARSATSLPVLRKDFTLDEVQILEAAAFGADAILLIAAILTVEELKRLREFAADAGLSALVEVHDDRELDEALESGAEIVGVNNRNLRTFEVDLATSLKLAERMPPGVVKVSESGIHSRADVRLLGAAGFDAFLVGEHLMRAEDPLAALRTLIS